VNRRLRPRTTEPARKRDWFALQGKRRDNHAAALRRRRQRLETEIEAAETALCEMQLGAAGERACDRLARDIGRLRARLHQIGN